jgi:hypothetical protein
MELIKVNNSDVLELNSKVIHKTTLEVGTYKGECLGFGKCKIDYGDGIEYPQPKRNIMKIVNYEN